MRASHSEDLGLQARGEPGSLLPQAIGKPRTLAGSVRSSSLHPDTARESSPEDCASRLRGFPPSRAWTPQTNHSLLVHPSRWLVAGRNVGIGPRRDCPALLGGSPIVPREAI